VLAAKSLLIGLLMAAPLSAPKPAIVWKPIPFGSARKAETAAYAQRHYGTSTWRLVHPRVIVEHYTASTSFASAYATFASDSADPELHELPGTCAHFVIDRDGTIYQLVSLSTMCRHTVGLNDTAIGIEHVATSDEQVLDNPRQLDSSLALTLWLMDRYGIQLRNVIGHNESLTSPYHHERAAAWRCQTHGDWTRSDMSIYRRRLAAIARRYRVPVGSAARRVVTHC
jgi:N-acetylmuramoyl-L-alanine amidase